MTKRDRVYVVENYLVEELTAALLAGEVGLAVTFECHANAARVHITDNNGNFWEIPTTAVCTVPEGHLSDLYEKACPACGLHLSLPTPTAASKGVDVMRPLEPIVDLGTTIRTRVACEVEYNDGQFAEVQTFGLEGIDKYLLLDRMQVHREDTSYSKEEFRQRFPVGALFEIKTTNEITPWTMPEDWDHDAA